MKNHLLLSFLAVLFFCPVIAAAVNSLSAADVAEIKQLHKQYESTWLKGDAAGDTPKVRKNYGVGVGVGVGAAFSKM